MILISTCKMGHGTFQAKFNPISKIDDIEKIYVIRKEAGIQINKIEYILLPKLVRFELINLFLTPLILLYYTLKLKPSFILAYHFIPHALFAFVVGKLTRKQVIFCQTGGKCQTYLKFPIVRQIVKSILNSCYSFNVPGKQSYQFWVENGIKKEKINILHSTIDTDRFYPTETHNFDYDILYVGVLYERKRVDWIIRGVAKLNGEGLNCKLGIVGKGKLMGNLQKLTSELNISTKVDFLGFQRDVKLFHDKTKIFAMTSDMEGLPVALMEAMSCEKLVVAPSVDNIPSILLDNVTGFCFNKNDYNEFLNKLRYALVNYESLQDIRMNARKMIVDEYSYPVAIRRWKKILGIEKY